MSDRASARSVLHALWLRGLRTPVSWRYGVGMVAALVPALLRIAMNPYWGLRFPYVFYFPATLFTALFGGLGPAWVGIGICAVVTFVWILPPTGRLIDIVGLVAFIGADGIIAWIGASHRDLIQQSERQTAELAARQYALERAAAEAETANRAKDDFVAVLSHELRTPLNTIVAGLRLLHRVGDTDGRAGRTREAIERQANYLTRMVDDLLDVRKIATGDILFECQPCDLAETIGVFVATLDEAGRFKDHVLFFDGDPVWVKADVVRCHQIVANLLDNAIKYTPAGGSIHVSVKGEGVEAVLRVQDTGIGITPDVLPRIFDLFVQGDPSADCVRSGLGIGLAVVRRLVELHGGTVEAASDGPGNGSAFTVRLPRVDPPPA